jgi:hypothetical protein
MIRLSKISLHFSQCLSATSTPQPKLVPIFSACNLNIDLLETEREFDTQTIPTALPRTPGSSSNTQAHFPNLIIRIAKWLDEVEAIEAKSYFHPSTSFSACFSNKFHAQYGCTNSSVCV